MSVPPPEHLSPSGWSKWDGCRLAWKRRYVDRLPEPPTLATEVGSFSHRVFELLYAQRPAERTLGAARAIARDVWAAPGEIDLTVAPEAVFRRLAWRAITGLWEREPPTRVEVVATERRVSWDLQGVPMQCVVDRVERNSAALLTIADYKTGSFKRPYQAPYKRQIAVGAHAVAHEHGYAEVGARGKLLYVVADRTEPADTDPATLASVAAQAESTWWEITEACRLEDFPPNPGPLCGHCPALRDCPEGLREVERRRASGWLKADNPGLAVLAELEAA